MNNLKQTLKEMAEFYENLSTREDERAIRAKSEATIKYYETALSYNKGRAKGVKEALEIIEKYIG